MNAAILFAQNRDIRFTEDEAVGLALLCGLSCFGIVFNFLPFFIAAMRGHQNTAAIFVLTLFLGWTGIGWIVALVWAFTAVDRGGRRRRRYDDDYD